MRSQYFTLYYYKCALFQVIFLSENTTNFVTKYFKEILILYKKVHCNSSRFENFPPLFPICNPYYSMLYIQNELKKALTNFYRHTKTNNIY